MPRPTPCCFLNASLCRSRSAITAVMSTSLKVVSIAAVLLRLDQALARSSRGASTCARALRCGRRRRGGASATGAPARLRRSRRAGVGRGRCRWRRLRLPAPSPGRRPPARRRASSRGRHRRCPARASRSTSCSSAALLRGRRRARSLGAAAPPPALRGGAARVAGFAAGASRPSAPAAALVDDAEHLADLDVLAFLCDRCCVSTPACGAATSRSILSVSSSTSGSPTATRVAFLLQPLRDARLDDRLTELRERRCLRHMIFSMPVDDAAVAVRRH